MKKVMMIMALMATMLCANAQAPVQRVPAAPYPITKIQPNGDKLTILLRGDEWGHWAMTVDGWQILENEKGYLCYAQLDKKGNLRPARKVAKDADNRKKSETRWLQKHGIQKMNKD